MQDDEAFFTIFSIKLKCVCYFSFAFSFFRFQFSLSSSESQCRFTLNHCNSILYKFLLLIISFTKAYDYFKVSQGYTQYKWVLNASEMLYWWNCVFKRGECTLCTVNKYTFHEWIKYFSSHAIPDIQFHGNRINLKICLHFTHWYWF